MGRFLVSQKLSRTFASFWPANFLYLNFCHSKMCRSGYDVYPKVLFSRFFETEPEGGKGKGKASPLMKAPCIA